MEGKTIHFGGVNYLVSRWSGESDGIVVEPINIRLQERLRSMMLRNTPFLYHPVSDVYVIPDVDSLGHYFSGENAAD